jgi:hypothetical protein
VTFLLIAGLPGQETRPASRASDGSRPAAENAAPARGPEGARATLSEEQEAVLARCVLDLGREDEAARALAIESLSGLAGLAPLRIAEGFRHELARVRVASLRVFRFAPQACVADRAMLLFRDHSAEVREEAVLLVSKLAPEGHVAELLLVLRHETEARVLRQVIAGIAAAGELDAVPELVDALARSTDPYVQKKCADALRSLTGGVLAADAEAWREWWLQHEPRVRAHQRRTREGDEGRPEADRREPGEQGGREPNG